MRGALFYEFAGGQEAPYVWQDLGYKAEPRLVFPVIPKVAYGAGARTHVDHFAAGAAGTVYRGRIHYAARWACGGESVQATFLAELGDYELCTRCTFRWEPTVYRCLSRRRELLYVGCSGSMRVRKRQHALGSPWWPEVASITQEKFSSYPLALMAERDAIWTEHPIHNIAGRADLAAA